MNSIFQRTSVREFGCRPVEEEKLEQILRSAMQAPSAGNQQPWEFYVVRDSAKIQQLSQTSPYAGCAKNATVCLVPCYRKEGLRHAAYADIDMSACCENILIEAVELGLGAVWLGIAPLQERMEAVAQVLQLPDSLAAFAILPLGYPLIKAEPKERYEAKRIHWL